MSDAANSIYPIYASYFGRVKAKPGASVAAAIVIAFNNTFSNRLATRPNATDATRPELSESQLNFYLNNVANFTADQLNRIQDSPKNIRHGIDVGVNIAKMVINARANDGYLTVVPVIAPPCNKIGLWCPEDSFTGAYSPAGLPAAQIAEQKPFAMKSPSEFRVVPPLNPASDDFLYNLNITYLFGGQNSLYRTAESSNQAFWWAQSGAHAVTSRLFDAIVTNGNMLLSLHDTARKLALVLASVGDAFIANSDSKKRYLAWRPFQAIHYYIDPTWKPYLPTPGNPEYPAGHPQVTGAGAAALRLVFKYDKFPCPITIPNSNTNPLTQTFVSLTNVMEDVIEARVKGGMHLPSSGSIAVQYGTLIAQNVHKSLLPVLK
ncbi:unnamed protein product [Didymodactylos carnosus]|uniref:Vanadium-dependent haloperoxidase n=1 Tax=Didymodactylos carnosus TaxID=1234261 RepID=A0A8S2EIZ7_9BILA|nr:unnamed protein product [Didymodactylos carnosus]CAF3987370.1 unnamed protein product [Didymodactylos carnosus]